MKNRLEIWWFQKKSVPLQRKGAHMGSMCACVRVIFKEKYKLLMH